MALFHLQLSLHKILHTAVWGMSVLALSGYICIAQAQNDANPTVRGHSAQTLQTCTITHVADGDTLNAICQRPQRNRRIRIRLKGIDAPEAQQAYGQAATSRLRSLCLHQTVQLPKKLAKDRFNRVLADLQCRGQDAGEYMVRAGLAWYYRSTAQQYPRLVQLEAQAKRSRLGLWGQYNPIPPWQWRRGKR